MMLSEFDNYSCSLRQDKSNSRILSRNHPSKQLQPYLYIIFFENVLKIKNQIINKKNKILIKNINLCSLLIILHVLYLNFTI